MEEKAYAVTFFWGPDLNDSQRKCSKKVVEQREKKKRQEDEVEKKFGPERIQTEKLSTDLDDYGSKEKITTGKQYREWSDNVSRKIRGEFINTLENSDYIVVVLDYWPDRLLLPLSKAWAEILCYEQSFVTTTTSHWRPKVQLAVFGPEKHYLFQRACALPDLILKKISEVDSFDLSKPLLLTGPSGCGKSYFARVLFNCYCDLTEEKEDSTGGKDFRQVNLSTIPSDQFEEKFMGHKKGAYTGATSDRKGLFPSMEGGTILLDEIQSLGRENQANLLTYLDQLDGRGIEVRPVGTDESGEQEGVVKLNLICTTNKDVQQAINDRTLRGDLVNRFRKKIHFDGLRDESGPLAHDEYKHNNLKSLVAFFVMKNLPSLSERINNLKRTKDKASFQLWGLNKDLLDKDSTHVKNLTDFHWHGNLRTFDRYCRHVMDAADNRRDYSFGCKEWKKWGKEQHRDPEAPEQREPDSTTTGESVQMPRKEMINSMTPQTKENYEKLLRDAKRGKSWVDAARELGIDVRTLRKKWEQFGLLPDDS